MGYPVIWSIGRIGLPFCPCCGSYLENTWYFKVVLKNRKKPESRIGKYRLLYCSNCNLPFTRKAISYANRAEYAGYYVPEFRCDGTLSIESVCSHMGIHVSEIIDIDSLKEKQRQGNVSRKAFTTKEEREQQNQLAKYPSAILMLRFAIGDELCDFIIVNDIHDADPGKRIIHYSYEDARTLLSIAYFPQCRFHLKEKWTKYRFHSVVLKQTGLVNPSPIMQKEIIIRKGGGYHQASNHVAEVVSVLLFSPYTNRLELAKASYDKTLNEYYMDLTKLREFVDHYGNPGLPIRFVCDNPDSFHSGLREESILKEYGYSVSQTDGLLPSERRSILTELVDLNITTISNIVKLLCFFIDSHPGDKYYYAREKWEDDKQFISGYKADPNRFVIGERIKHNHYTGNNPSIIPSC